MRTRRGGLLSASAFAALGASVLLVSLIGLGLSALADQPRGGGLGEVRREAAAVVVPPVAVSRDPAKPGRQAKNGGSATSPTFAPVAPAPAPTRSTSATRPPATAPTPVTTTRSTTRSTSPTPSPTPRHGKGHGAANGAGKGNGNGGGHKKP